MKRLTPTAALLLGGLLWAGCRSAAQANAVLEAAKPARVAPEYVIGAGDGLTITVLGTEHALTAIVRPDGTISFPIHGEIRVEGKTVPRLRSELERAFKTSLGLIDPTVYVTVNSFGSKAVTVLGHLNGVGRFPYTKHMRVTDVLALARGFRLTAAANRTLLYRQVDGGWKVYRIRLEDFLRDADFTTNLYVRPGDILYVPPNGWARAAERVALWTSPVRAIFAGVPGLRTPFFFP